MHCSFQLQFYSAHLNKISFGMTHIIMLTKYKSVACHLILSAISGKGKVTLTLNYDWMHSFTHKTAENQASQGRLIIFKQKECIYIYFMTALKLLIL
jgi:hypothetical protein